MIFVTGVFLWISFGRIRCGQYDSNVCPEQCTCERNILRCNRNVLNETIPDNVSEIHVTINNPEDILVDLPESESNGSNITKLNRSNIIKLVITVTGYKALLHFGKNAFKSLSKLQYLGIHGIIPALYAVPDSTMDAGCFSGLDKVRTLNLSGNSHLNVSEVIRILKEVNTLPSLETIDLSELQVLANKPIYNNEFKDLMLALGSRSVKEIIMDNTNVELNFAALRTLCQTLEKVSLKQTKIISLYEFQHISCDSLKELDLSESQIGPISDYIRHRILQHGKWFEGIYNYYGSIVWNVETVIYNSILRPGPHALSLDKGDVFQAKGINWGVKYLYFRHNYMENFNVSFKDMPLIPGTELDFSYNNIHYIHPKLFDPGHNVTKINLAHNKLYRMEKNYFLHFSYFLQTFIDLEEINLEANQITKFPTRMFLRNTKLKKINLAGNYMKTLSVELSSIPQLKLIDISNNAIQSFHLDEFMKKNNFISENANPSLCSNVTINITGNELKCACDSLDDVRRLRDSSLVRGGICSYDDMHLDIKKDAFRIITDQCNQKKARQNLIIGTCISLTLLCLSALCVVLIVRYKKRQNGIRAFLRQLKADDNQFLVFVSYCSEDTDFVMAQLVDQLNDEICAKTKVQRDYVCYGDRHFRPGFPVITEIMTKMENSNVIIFVISSAFCNKSWCHIEIKQAYELQKPIILIFKEKVKEQDMPKLVSKLFHQNTRCKFELDGDGVWTLQPPFHVLTSSVLQLAALNKETMTTEDQYGEEVV